MTQQDVLDFLKENDDKWLFAKDISNGLKASYNCIARNLRSLRKGNIIEFKSIGNRDILMYKYKE